MRVSVFAVVLLASVAWAQKPQMPDPAGETRAVHVMGVNGMTFEFVSGDMGIGGQVVKGAPYSAEAVTEVTQTLADGNKIRHKMTSKVYRDSEGRTRREQTLDGIGPLAAPANAPKLIIINDPVAGANYILEPERKIARKMPLPSTANPIAMKVSGGVMGAAVAGGEPVFFSAAVPPPVPGVAHTGSAVAATGAIGGSTGSGPRDMIYHQRVAAPENVKTEPLGSQMIEGVEADGTRMTMTIPAGQIGNERPIEMVTERWYSPTLQTVVMTRRSDPRSGETAYKLTGIDRSEPDPSLFQPPADYQVVDATAGLKDVKVLQHQE